MNAIVSVSLLLVFVESTALFYLMEWIEELEIKLRDDPVVRG